MVHNGKVPIIYHSITIQQGKANNIQIELIRNFAEKKCVASWKTLNAVLMVSMVFSTFTTRNFAKWQRECQPRARLQIVRRECSRIKINENCLLQKEDEKVRDELHKVYFVFVQSCFRCKYVTFVREDKILNKFKKKNSS